MSTPGESYSLSDQFIDKTRHISTDRYKILGVNKSKLAKKLVISIKTA
jgi:hypothetical protein